MKNELPTHPTAAGSEEAMPASDPQNPKLWSPLPWSPWFGIIYAVFIFFAAQIIASLVIGLYVRLQHWTTLEANDWLQNSVFAQFWFVLMAEALTFWAIWWFVQYRKRTLRSIGLKAARLHDVLIAFGTFAVYFVAVGLVLYAFRNLVPGLNFDQKQDIGFEGASYAGGFSLVVTFVSLVVLPPLVEEVVFRGFVFGGLRGKLRFLPAALVTSLIFGAAHLQIGSGKPLLWVAGIDTFTLSFVLCYVRDRSGSLWPGIFVHALKNGIAFASLFLLHVR